jgi:hypothetical protein
MRRAWVPLAAVAAAAFAAAQDPAPLPPPEMVWEGRFATSVVCARCHENHAQSAAMRDAKKRPIGPVDLWQSSMMANAARDPLWRAAVSVETAATPSRRAAIEAKCLHCHAPMASTEAKLSKEPPVAMSLLEKRTPRTHLALDGVSCALCHQIQPDGLGTEASYTGGYVIKDTKAVIGPHQEPFAAPMQNQSGYTPTHGPHVMESSLCATCHTVMTGTLAADGKPTGALFHEQSTYAEWSAGPRTRSCQDCHMPTRDADGAAIQTMIARAITGKDDADVKPRSPYGRHLFVGGNTLVPAILRDAKELGAGAPREAFDATIAAARTMLSKETARVSIVDAGRDGRKTTVRVRIETLTGHKFPTGVSMRRAWLRVVARDAKQRVVFASGAHDAEGRIVGGDGKPLAFEAAGGPIEPERGRVSGASEAAIFESVMADSDGRPTFLLMRAAKYAKDNRLVPGTPSTTAFEFEADGPVTVTATLLFQPLASRYAAELLRWDTPEVRAFRRMWEKASRAPETVAEATTEVR